MLTRFRNVSFLMAYAVATIPLWHYIRDGRILALMVAVVAFCYFNIVLSTVQVAQPILSSEKAKVPLPRWLPDRPKYHKWWMLVRRTLKWHLLLIPPKMGLALGFVVFLTTRTYPSSYTSDIFLRNYRYAGNIRDHFYFLDAPTPFPQMETLLLGCVVIVIFSFATLGLLCAIVISTKRGYIPVFVKSIATIFVIMGIPYIIISSYPYTTLLKLPSNMVYTTTNTIVEQGVLLSANIMRPLHGGTGGGTVNPSGRWDNRRFVIEQLGIGLIGLLLYVGATWVALWFIDDREKHRA